jgi:hypothetical protein
MKTTNRITLFAGLIMLLAFITTSASAQQRISLEPFNSISMDLPGELIVKKGNVHQVVIEADDSDLEKIETEVRSNTLKIGSKNNGWSWRNSFDKIKFIVTTPDLQKVAIGGSGSVFSEDVWQAETFQLVLSGSGSANLQVDVKEIKNVISGSGKIKLAGNAGNTEIVISGSGRLEALDLKTRSLEARISGSGNCEVTAEESIMANISGSGKIYYQGSPSRIEQNVSGSGKIKKI